MPLIASQMASYAVTLTDSEMACAEAAGHARYEDSRARNLSPRGCSASPEADVEAAAAELAVALLLGQTQFEPTVGSFHGADLTLPNGKALQIRSTPRLDGGLVWRDGDSESDLFVLVVGSGPSWTVVGCNWGKCIRDRGFALRDGREECRIMPQGRLVALDMIPWLREFLPEAEDV